MQLLPLPAFNDNYIWLVHHAQAALVVDPGDAAPVLAWLAEHPSVRLDTILVTHHHADHTGGVAELQALTGARVFAPAQECAQLQAQRVGEASRFDALGHPFRVLDVPGHTAGHVAYVCDGTPTLLFAGDTLFGAGCGRLFEGTPTQMAESLGKLAALPADTRVCAAHEYTLSNLAFAQAVEPGSQPLAQRLARDQALRNQGQPTLPSTLALELATNPFLRTHLPNVQTATQVWGQSQPGGDPTDPQLPEATRCLARLREWKNRFQ